MSGLLGPEVAGPLTAWVAAAATLLAWSILVGARRPFVWSQRLLAGLLTGYLALLAIREVLIPRLVEPLLADPTASPVPWLGLVLAAMLLAARWLPRWVGAVPVAVLVGSIAAFALGGAVAGTVLPQIVGIVPAPGVAGMTLLTGIVTAVITVLVLLAFLHGRPQGRVLGRLSAGGRWLILGGVGAWLGYLVLSRLVLLTDRLDFLATDWLGLLP